MAELGFKLSLLHIKAPALNPYGALSVSATRKKDLNQRLLNLDILSKNKNKGQSLSCEEKMKELGVFD